MDMPFLYTKVVTHDKKVLNKSINSECVESCNDLAAVVSRLEK